MPARSRIREIVAVTSMLDTRRCRRHSSGESLHADRSAGIAVPDPCCCWLPERQLRWRGYPPAKRASRYAGSVERQRTKHRIFADDVGHRIAGYAHGVILDQIVPLRIQVATAIKLKVGCVCRDDRVGDRCRRRQAEDASAFPIKTDCRIVGDRNVIENQRTCVTDSASLWLAANAWISSGVISADGAVRDSGLAGGIYSATVVVNR